MTPSALRLTCLALVVWAVCFWVLHRTGQWLHMAFAGCALGIAVVVTGAVPKALLQPTRRALAFGALSGIVMVAVTQAGYRVAAQLWPAVVAETGALVDLLYVVGFPRWARALLIATIASSEELVFRGLLPNSPATCNRWRPGGREILAFFSLTLLYAFTTAPLGSGLLVGCALVCGLIWGVLRLMTRSLVVPILAHLIWDMGVMILWPLPTAVGRH